MPRNPGMRMKRHGVAFLAAGCAIALALAGAAMAALHAHTAAKGVAVTVTEREYHIGLSRTTLPAGSITLTVHNAGKIAHALALSGAGLKTTVKVPAIAPGKTRTVTVKVTGGKLSAWCPIPGHAAEGMKASFSVKGAAGASSGGTAGSSGGTTGGTSSGGTTTDSGGDVWG